MKQTIIIALISMSFFARLFGAPDHEQRKIQIQKRESDTHDAEALDRRSRSIAFLKAKGVPTIDHLPVIEDSVSAKMRSPKEIAERLVACTICAVGGETGDKTVVRKLLLDFNAEGLLTPDERVFVASKIDVPQERVQFSWRYERAWVLLWALGYIERLDYPPSICDVPRLAGLIRGKSIEQILREARPRGQKEILDEADLIYRVHWAVVDERVNVNKSVKVPGSVEKGVVQERHAALNWLIGYMRQEWDDISTDT